MKNSHLHYIGLLLLFASSFAAYNWIFGYVTALQYETPDCFFVFGYAFLAEWLDHPGGLLVYAGRFFRQFYHYEWLGALTIASLLTAFGLLLYLVRRKLSQTAGIFHTFFPCTFLLALTAGTDVTLGLITTCIAYLIYLSIPGRISRQTYALLATLGLYLAIGGYFWFFVAWVIASTWFDRPLSSGLPFKLLYPIFVLCLPLAAYRWFFPISLESAFIYPFVISPSILDLAISIYLLLVPFWAKIPWGTRLESSSHSPRGLIAQTALLILLVVSMLYSSYDSTTREFAEYHQLYKTRQWDGILARAAADPPPHSMIQFFTNFALYHKGKLLEEMFSYPQLWGTRGLILSDSEAKGDLNRAIYNSDLFFEMGHINASFRFAYNQLNLGKTYGNLRRLAECNMVNGNYAMAAKYLNTLEKSLFHDDIARNYKAIIGNPEAANKRFAPLRANLPTVEFDLRIGEFSALLALLKSNPRNRMALDYLTAWCLLDKESVPLFAANIHLFKGVGYAALPTHCQEALLLWEKAIGARIEKGEFSYAAQTEMRFARFGQQIRQYPDIKSAQSGLHRAFGNTFMYYYATVSPPYESPASSSWLLLGNELFSRGEVDEAILYYHRALRGDPEYAEAHISLGNALMSQGKTEAAAAYYTRALELKPGPEGARQHLGENWQLRSH
jgi:tetratricopeptide (TPR) repeat protein